MPGDLSIMTLVVHCCYFFPWPRLYFCLSAISTTVFDVIVCLVFVSSRFDIVKKRVLKVNCVPIFYSFKTPKKRRQMPSWVVACYKQLNQSLLRIFCMKLMLANLFVYTVWILTCREKQNTEGPHLMRSLGLGKNHGTQNLR